MKLISIKVHTDVVMVVPNDYDTNDSSLIEAISEGVKQDLVNVFDDTMVTIKELKTVNDIPPDYMNVEPWLAPDVDLAERKAFTCKQLMEPRIHEEE